MTETLLTTLPIAGVQYHEGKEILTSNKGPTINTQLFLEPEPENQYDQYAVKILLCNIMLGYIPKTHSQLFATLLRHGIPLTVRYAGFREFGKRVFPAFNIFLQVNEE